MGISYAGVAQNSADTPGDLLVGDVAYGARVVGTLISSSAILVPERTIESWSSLWSTAIRYNAVELP